VKKKLLRKATVITIVTALVIISIGKTHYGALSGWMTHMVYGDGTSEFISWIQQQKQKHWLLHRKKKRDNSNNTISFVKQQNCGTNTLDSEINNNECT